MSGARRGFSLLEVLLCAVLGLMLLTLLMRVFIPMSKGLVRGTDQSGLQQMASVALGRIGRELTKTPPQAVSVGNQNRTLALHSFREVNSSGRQLFAPDLTVFWYDPVGRKLYERRGAAPGLTNRIACRPGEPELVSLSTQAQGQRVLASEVGSFRVTATDLTVTVEIDLSRKAPDGGVPERFTLRRVYLLRNSTS